MKEPMMIAAAAMLVAAPLTLAAASEKAAPEKAAAETAEAAAPEGPTPAQLKARKAKKPIYMKVAEALKVAEATAQPLLVFMVVERDPASDFLEKKVLTYKAFRDELVKQNFVLLKLKIKAAAPANAKERPKKIDLKGMKPAEQKIVENFGLDESAAAQAKKNDKELTYNDIVNYPAVICLSPDGMKQLFRMGKFDKDGGMGVWISTVVDTLRSCGIDPVVSPKVQKIIDNPDDPKKWK